MPRPRSEGCAALNPQRVHRNDLFRHSPPDDVRHDWGTRLGRPLSTWFQRVTTPAPSVPSSPLQRTIGSIDAFVGKTDTPHIGEEATVGIDIDTRGWIADPRGEPVIAAWVEVAGFAVPIRLDRTRPDVASAHQMVRRSAEVGFETVVRLPQGVPPGSYMARVVGETKAGFGVYGDSTRRVRIAHARSSGGREERQATSVRSGQFAIRVSDTQLERHTLGRGRHTIRQEASLRLVGRIEEKTTLRVTAEPLSGATCFWEFECQKNGDFDVTLWTGGLQRGLYPLAIAAAGDATLEPIAWLAIDIAGPHYLPPMHLNRLRTPPAAELLYFADAAPRAHVELAEEYVAGHPIGVAGWCLDPVARMPVLAVYFQVDDFRPVPLSHGLTDPRPGGESQCGFAGMIDTARLDPGMHVIRILGAAVSGAGWYVISERQIELADHRPTY